MTRTIQVTIPIKNNSKRTRTVTYKAGSLIEVKQGGLQNVVVAETISKQLKPGESAEIRVRCYCVNADLSWPEKATGKLTKMVYVGPTTDQAITWNGIANPDVASNEEAKRQRELRKEMENVFALEDLQLITADIGLTYQNISGADRLDLKCLNLVATCMRMGKLGDLVTELRFQRPQSVVFSNIADALGLPPLAAAR